MDRQQTACDVKDSKTHLDLTLINYHLLHVMLPFLLLFFIMFLCERWVKAVPLRLEKKPSFSVLTATLHDRSHIELGAKPNHFFENLGPPPLLVRRRGPSADRV